MAARHYRDPANELYDQACSLLEAAQGLRAAASSWQSAPALAASLGCIEASLQEVRDAVTELGDTALTMPAGGDPVGCSGPWEPAAAPAAFALLARDLASAQASCAAARTLVGPLVAHWE